MNPNHLNTILLSGSWIGAFIAALTLSQVAAWLSIIFTILGIINFFFPLKIRKK